MSEQHSNDLGAFLAGFVIGGLVGAATAIILAPQSGQETRSKLANKSNELLQSGGARVQQVRETAGSYGHDYLEKASSALSSTRQQVKMWGDVCRNRRGLCWTKEKNRLPSWAIGSATALMRPTRRNE